MRSLGCLLVLSLVWGAGCGGRARVSFPAQLPAEPVHWPLPDGRNVVQLRGAALGHDGAMALPAATAVSKVRAVLARCQLRQRTPMTRLVLALPKLDKLTSGATVVLQGRLDAPALIACLTRLRGPVRPTAFKIGPYPGVRLNLGSQAVTLLATATNTVVIGVGGDAKGVVRVLTGRDDGLTKQDHDVHFGPGAADAAFTITSHRLYGSASSIFAGPILWAIDVTRHAWFRGWMRTPHELQVTGAIRTGGTLSAIRLQVQWKIVTALVARTSRDAGLLLTALRSSRRGHELRLQMTGGPAERAAFHRVLRGLFGRLGARLPAPRTGMPPGRALPPAHTPPGGTAPGGAPPAGAPAGDPAPADPPPPPPAP